MQSLKDFDVMISIQLNQQAADKAHKHFASGYGDHLSLPGTPADENPFASAAS